MLTLRRGKVGLSLVNGNTSLLLSSQRVPFYWLQNSLTQPRLRSTIRRDEPSLYGVAILKLLICALCPVSAPPAQWTMGNYKSLLWGRQKSLPAKLILVPGVDHCHVYIQSLPTDSGHANNANLRGQQVLTHIQIVRP